MKKKSKNISVKKSTTDSLDWLPIERWLVPSLHFTHVRGIARVFLIIEIGLSTLVVIGVLILVAMKYFQL